MQYTFEFNPDPSVRRFIIADGGRVLVPQMLEEKDVCLQKLKNWLEEPSLPGAPIVWDETQCGFGPGEWGCPTDIFEWDITVDEEPPEEGCGECDPTTQSPVKFAFETSTGLITHVCHEGSWLPFGGVGTTTSQCVIRDRATYDLTSWDFPVSFSSGGGQWNVYGIDRMTETCVDGLADACPGNLVEWACWGDNGSLKNPATTWNSLNWSDSGIVGGCNTDILFSGSSPCSRPAFRFDPNLPTSAIGPFDVTFTIPAQGATGSQRWAMYDITTNQNLDIGVLSQPSGSNAVIQTSTLGDVVQLVDALPGQYVFRFTPAPSTNPANLRMLAFNWGDDADSESMQQITTRYKTSGVTCCHTWNSVADVAAWLADNDPNGQTWWVDGLKVYADQVAGVGVNYGMLGHCDPTGNRTPTVMSVEICDDAPPVTPTSSVVVNDYVSEVLEPGGDYTLDVSANDTQCSPGDTEWFVMPGTLTNVTNVDNLGDGSMKVTVGGDSAEWSFKYTVSCNGTPTGLEGVVSGVVDLGPQSSEAKVFDSMLYTNGPDTVAAGLEKLTVLYQAFLYPNGVTSCSTALPTAADYDFAANHVTSEGNQYVMVDLEHVYPFLTSCNSSTTAILATILDELRSRLPATYKLGVYAVPRRDYWNAIAPGSAGHTAWQAINDAAVPQIKDHVDVYYPSIYTFYDPDNVNTPWVSYAQEQVNETNRFVDNGQEVMPVIWPQYHPSSSMAGQYLTGAQWRQQLETLEAAGVDGIQIWSGPEAWAGGDWWTETVNYVAGN